MKKFICMFLALVSVFSLAIPAFAAQPETVIPFYTNASSARVTLEIDNTGNATINVYSVGKTGTTKISVTYYLEKKVGSTWSRVDIPASNDQWTYSVSGRALNQTQSAQITSSGTYRATAIFEVTISFTETITVTDEFTF